MNPRVGSGLIPVPTFRLSVNPGDRLLITLLARDLDLHVGLEVFRLGGLAIDENLGVRSQVMRVFAVLRVRHLQRSVA